MMIYKGFRGKVRYDEEESIFFGEVTNSKDIITFQGDTFPELIKAFRNSIEDYLIFCEKINREPDIKDTYLDELLQKVTADNLHDEISL